MTKLQAGNHVRMGSPIVFPQAPAEEGFMMAQHFVLEGKTPGGWSAYALEVPGLYDISNTYFSVLGFDVIVEDAFIVEFKRRLVGQPSNWDSIPVCFRSIYTQDKYADQHAYKLCQEEGVAEVRWNKAGLYQGHYIQAPVKV
jgi:hypothetical protein